MGKLEIKKGKHKHILTDILKFSIFGVIMLAPFFSILSRCLYITFNKNAKDSYYGETINEVIRVNVDYEDLQSENDYYFSNELIFVNTATANNTFYISNLENISGMPSVINPLNVTSFVIRTASDSRTYIQYFNQSSLLGSNDLTSTIINIKFTLDSLSVNDSMEYYNYFYYNTYNKYSFLDNAFIYSVNELHNQQIFNWTKNTAIYTTINTMTTGLGFNNNNNTLALLLTYWALNTAVYIIFDIVIWAFTKLTHIMQE